MGGRVVVCGAVVSVSVEGWASSQLTAGQVTTGRLGMLLTTLMERHCDR